MSDALLAELERKAGELEADLRQVRGELARLNAIEEDVEDLFAELDERAAPDAPMHVKLRGAEEGYPFGEEYPFGISIDGAVVTVYPQIVYHGGTALEVGKTTIKIKADGDWIALQYDPDTEAATLIRWPAASGLPQDHDGLLVRGIWRFALAGEEGAEAASLDRAGWSPGNLAMMAEDGT